MSTMRRLQGQGFEVGYHYNTLERCHGDFARAIALFEKDLRGIRAGGVNVTAVKYHANPRVRRIGYDSNADILDNDPDLLQRNRLWSFDAYLSTLTRQPGILQVMDLGIRWNPSITTAELLRRIGQREWTNIYMLIHPDYWSRSVLRAVGLQIAARLLRHGLNDAIASARQVLVARRPRTRP